MTRICLRHETEHADQYEDDEHSDGLRVPLGPPVLSRLRSDGTHCGQCVIFNKRSDLFRGSKLFFTVTRFATCAAPTAEAALTRDRPSRNRADAVSDFKGPETSDSLKIRPTDPIGSQDVSDTDPVSVDGNARLPERGPERHHDKGKGRTVSKQPGRTFRHDHVHDRQADTDTAKNREYSAIGRVVRVRGSHSPHVPIKAGAGRADQRGTVLRAGRISAHGYSYSI